MIIGLRMLKCWGSLLIKEVNFMIIVFEIIIGVVKEWLKKREDFFC